MAREEVLLNRFKLLLTGTRPKDAAKTFRLRAAPFCRMLSVLSNHGSPLGATHD
jgi:hypothetical protein